MPSIDISRSKPHGWWTTHPTILNVAVHGAFDANGDGLGDFEGVRQKLDYFLDMGISGYRFQHVGNYGDDPQWSGLVQQDWFDVDPHYGTMADFDRLMRECASKDIKIIMMTVPEYVGWHHPDYLAAQKAHEQGVDDPRVNWFEWRDDGTVVTCWDRPAPDCSNPEYLDAYLKHIGFWMDKGVAGWEADAVPVWHNLTVEGLRRFTDFVKARGGFVTAENNTLQTEVMRRGGFNAGPGKLRHELYHELDAIMQGKADFIRQGLRVRDELIGNGMFPYQEFGDGTYATLHASAVWHHLEMFKLQVAFNAVLPDQVWILGSGMTFTETKTISPQLAAWSSIDWKAVEAQDKDPSSPLSHVKRLFSLRARTKELAVGHIEEVRTDHPDDVFAAIRTSEDREERALVVFNFSQQTREVTVFLSDGTIKRLRNYLNGEFCDVTGGCVSMKMQLLGYKFLKVMK